jgi:hypothetical protein
MRTRSLEIASISVLRRESGEAPGWVRHINIITIAGPMAESTFFYRTQLCRYLPSFSPEDGNRYKLRKIFRSEYKTVEQVQGPRQPRSQASSCGSFGIFSWRWLRKRESDASEEYIASVFTPEDLTRARNQQKQVGTWVRIGDITTMSKFIMANVKYNPIYLWREAELKWSYLY